MLINTEYENRVGNLCSSLKVYFFSFFNIYPQTLGVFFKLKVGKQIRLTYTTVQDFFAEWICRFPR